MKLLISVAIAVVFSTISGDVGAQTRFQFPDTIPNYSAYKYADECLVAIKRLTDRDIRRDTVWKDTLIAGFSGNANRVSPETIKYGRLCLEKVNLDTISSSKSLTHSKERELIALVDALLMVGREQDVIKLLKRFLDSAPTYPDWGKIYRLATLAYSTAKPIHIEGLKSLAGYGSYAEASKEEAEAIKIHAELNVGLAALSLGDTLLAKQKATEIIKTLSEDSLRTRSSWKDGYFIRDAFTLVHEAFLEDGMDSLKVSTYSFRSYLESILSKFTDGPLSITREAVGQDAPPVTGKYWYKNGWKLNTSGELVFSDEVVRTEPQVLPKPGKVNALLFLQGALCHTESYYPQINGRSDGQGRGEQRKGKNGGKCWESAATVKRLKKEFPDLEVTVLSRTFGSIGGSSALDPATEADRLSGYLLGFYEIPGIHAISETEFTRISGFDNRRIDFDVAYQSDYRSMLGDQPLGSPPTGVIILVDDKGLVFHNVTQYKSTDRAELIMRKKLAAVFSRIKQK